MRYKLGIMGHSLKLERLCEMVKALYQDIEVRKIPVDEILSMPEMTALIKSEEEGLEGLLFTGSILYDLLINITSARIPWDYIRNDHGQLMRILSQAGILDRRQIHAVSIDSFDHQTALRTYGDIGVAQENLRIFIARRQLYDKGYLAYLKDFHERRYKEDGVSFSITGVTKVYAHLRERGIPCYKLEPGLDSVQQVMGRFLLRKELDRNKENQSAILAVKIDKVSEYSLLHENEYAIMAETMEISKEIYLFAQLIQGAVVEEDRRSYLIFCTKSILEKETGMLQYVPLLERVAENTAYTISIGIGYGGTACEAKLRAVKGVRRAQAAKGNKAFAVYGPKDVLGPILPRTPSEAEEPGPIDPQLQEIARRTGLSVNRVFQLSCILRQRGGNSFTPRELAEDCGITLRSINRIILKLEQAGFAETIGSRMVSDAGRPSRIIRLSL